MRVASNDEDGRAGLRGSVQFNKYTHTHTHTVNFIYLRQWHRVNYLDPAREQLLLANWTYHSCFVTSRILRKFFNIYSE